MDMHTCPLAGYPVHQWLISNYSYAFSSHSLAVLYPSVVPFPPLLQKWSQGPSASLPRGESVSLSVLACNADSFNWLCNGVPVGCPNEPYYRFTVDPSTCGDYRCSVGNRHGSVQTPPTAISMSDEPTSYSVTNAILETTYNLGITPRPSTSLGECVAM